METKKLLRILKFLILMLFVNVCYAGCEPKSLTSVENEPQLLIFVSLSMPEQSLKLWAEQAEKIKGKLLLKGFVDDSLQATIDSDVLRRAVAFESGYRMITGLVKASANLAA